MAWTITGNNGRIYSKMLSHIKLPCLTSLLLLVVITASWCAGGDTNAAVKHSDWETYVLPPASKAISAGIQKYRTGEIKLSLKDSLGGPLKKKNAVSIEMIRHAFLFGCGIIPAPEFYDSAIVRQKIRNALTSLFNYATLGVFWNLYEGEKGKPYEIQVRRFALWCRENHIRLKGHPLVWFQGIAPWARQLPQPEFEAAQKKRVMDMVGGYAGLIDTWDVFNESLVGPKINNNPLATWINREGAAQCVRQSLSWARSANPGAFLLVNDFNTSSDYDKQIAYLIHQGQAPDAIGIQAHFEKRFPPDTSLWNYLERVKKLNIPIHITETSLPSGELIRESGGWGIEDRKIWKSTSEGERFQAIEVVRLYRLLFSHPSVEAITWWDLCDPDWEAPTGLLRNKNRDPKPVYDALMKLIHDEWTTRLTAKTDRQGSITFRGYFGHYQLTINGITYEFDLKKGVGTIEIRLMG